MIESFGKDLRGSMAVRLVRICLVTAAASVSITTVAPIFYERSVLREQLIK